MTLSRPIFWSFRRCPYAMRARLAVQSSGVQVELREILLKDKPDAFLQTSASATVPAVKDGDLILDESFDVMRWALVKSDPDGWLDMPDGWETWIEECDGPFKVALDHTKYAVRYPDKDEAAERAKASVFLQKINLQLNDRPFLFGDRKTLADMAILPFIRQFANTDRAWFDAQDWPNLIRWLDSFLDSAEFAGIMTKYKPWVPDQDPVIFPS